MILDIACLRTILCRALTFTQCCRDGEFLDQPWYRIAWFGTRGLNRNLLGVVELQTTSWRVPWPGNTARAEKSIAALPDSSVHLDQRCGSGER